MPATHLLSRTGSYDGSSCNARVTKVQAFDTGGAAAINRIVYTANNMTASIPSLLQPQDTVVYTVQVVDSMSDGVAVFSITDVYNNTSYDTIRYCTIPDQLAPRIALTQSDTGIWVQIMDGRAWDRHLDSVYVAAMSFSPDTSAALLGLKGKSAISFFSRADSASLFHSDGELYVYARDLAGNSADTVLHFEVTMGVENKGQRPALIYPNPSTGLIAIALPVRSSELVTVQDLLGRVVAQCTIHGTGELDISSLAPGTYILRVGSVTRKIIKQ